MQIFRRRRFRWTPALFRCGVCADDPPYNIIEHWYRFYWLWFILDWTVKSSKHIDTRTWGMP